MCQSALLPYPTCRSFTIVFIKGVNTQHAFYDPTRSSTVVRLPGKSDRNGVHGKYYTDVFTVGDLPAVRQNFIGIVSTDGNRSLDDWQDSYGFGGQLGLGLRDNESMVGDTFMEGLFKAGAISKKLFALQVSIDSFIQFGAINHTAYVDNILWSPVLTHVGGWAVQSDGYVINNKVVPNTGGPLQFETAATYTTIPERIASKLFAHIDHKLSKFDWDSTSAQLLFKCHISDKETVGYSIKGRKYSLPLKTLINREVSLPCDMRRRPLDSAALIISGATVMAIETDNEVANKSHRSMISSLFMQRFYGIFDSEHDDGKPASIWSPLFAFKLGYDGLYAR
ncbi:BQ2448_6106 [Microbotryum intermedium]|uniref:BQ2448_6106 protein n=1 Tax=Microbotryum intermedium TaxID=269621 RepID=A0A238FRE9_9BASI|nr:BQ2448_6106 [Microbotryum intermedium]